MKSLMKFPIVFCVIR